MNYYKNILAFFLFGVLISCDDGDIVVTTFEFDDASLELCEGASENEFVFFKINSSVNEAISFRFINASYNETTATSTPIEVTLDGVDNQVIYRQFNTSITNDYFCTTVPQSGLIVTNELISNQGTAKIAVAIVSEDDNDGVDPIDESGGIDPVGDNDNDNLLNYLDPDDRGDGTAANCEDVNPADGICDLLSLDPIFDADGDGIPNFKDQDDDNDNILTSAELPNDIPDDDSPRNTDGDNLPDYLDADDDGDGILTVNEDTDSNGNPRDDDDNDNGVPNYLDQDDTTSTPNDPSKPNSVETTFRTSVDITGLEFNNTDENFESSTFSFGFRDRTIQIEN